MDSIYDGDFVKEERQGFGKYSCARSGITYDGTWSRNLPDCRPDQILMPEVIPMEYTTLITAGQR